MMRLKASNEEDLLGTLTSVNEEVQMLGFLGYAISSI